MSDASPDSRADLVVADGSATADQPTRVRFAVGGWLAAAAAIAYLCRNSIPVAEKTIRLDMGLSEEAMGWILGPAFFWTYALAQIPTAWVCQRWGSRRVLPLFAVAWSVSTAGLGCIAAAWWMLGNRMLSGLAQAGLFPGATRSIADWYPPGERALASGVLGAAMSVGGAVGAVLTGYLLAYVDWRTIFALYAAPGLCWAVWFWWWFRDSPSAHSAVNRWERERIAAGRPSGTTASALPDRDMWRALATSPATWLICGQQFFRAAGYAFFSSWFATFLQETRGVSTAASGLLTVAPLVAIVLSSTLGGGLSDWVYRRTDRLAPARQGVAVVSLLACTLLVLTSYFVRETTMAIAVLSLGVFFSGFAGPCAYAVTMDLGGRHVAALFSTMNMIGNVGAGLLPWLVPRFKRWIESQDRVMELLGQNGWNGVLILFGGVYLLAAVCWFLLNTESDIFAQSWWPASRAGSGKGDAHGVV